MQKQLRKWSGGGAWVYKVQQYKYGIVGPVLFALLSISSTCFGLFVLARDEVHLTRRTYLIVIPDFDCVGGRLGCACTVP